MDSNESDESLDLIHEKINKTPTVKKAKLVSKPDHKKLRPFKTVTEPKQKRVERVWDETKIFYLPLMPTDNDEKNAYIEREYRCTYCDDLCDEENLECKVCSKVFHITCLNRRGHLNSLKVPLRIEWACSDCADLSRCLNDDELRKIINVYDELDFKKNCYVSFEDYMRIKKRLFERDGDEMAIERVQEEEKRFRLMDKDRSGSITWNEFVEFEAANLLAKKNKIELSNYLSLKELIVAKKMFLSKDKDNLQMITKEDAKSCYVEFIQKLRIKLGPAFSEHISNCLHLFGLGTENEQKTNSAKTIWPEFVRKLTILLLYDRLNSTHFTPKYWTPGNWYSFIEARSRPASTPKQDTSLPPIGIKKTDQSQESYLDLSQIMSQNMELNNFKHHEFGSYQYVIRAKNCFSRLSGTDSDDDNDIVKNDYKPKHVIPHYKNNSDLKSSSSINFSMTNRNNRVNQAPKSQRSNKNNFENSSGFFMPNSASYGAFSYRPVFNSGSFNQFDYNKVTKDIYKNFGKLKLKQSNQYAQQQTTANSDENGKRFHLPDLVEDRSAHSASNVKIRTEKPTKSDSNFSNKILNSPETNISNIITN